MEYKWGATVRTHTIKIGEIASGVPPKGAKTCCVFFCFQSIANLHGSATVLQGRRRKPMRNGKIWHPPPPLNPLTDRHQNLHMWLMWLCSGYYHPAKFYPDSTRRLVSVHAQIRALNFLLGYFLVTRKGPILQWVPRYTATVWFIFTIHTKYRVDQKLHIFSSSYRCNHSS